MKREDKALLIALCMGDGRVQKSSSKALRGRFVMTHSEKQAEYIKHKAKLINSICGGKQCEVQPFNNSGYPGLRYGKTHRYFGIIHKWLYKHGKKVFPDTLLNRLDKRCIAYLWMDDGSLTAKRRNGKICAWVGYLNLYEDFETCERFAKVFTKLFGITPLIRRSKNFYRLEFNTTLCKKFLPEIAEYVVPSLKYKVTMIR